MILIGQYDSPYARRVAISLRALDLPYEHDTRSIFGDFDALRRINPTGRIPALVLDNGEVLVDSVTILDHIDQVVGPERALVPPSGDARRRALRVIALASAAIDKAGASMYERKLRPPALRWPEWIERCRVQAAGALAALEAEPWPATERLDQAQITAACTVRFFAAAEPELLGAGRYPALEALSARCEARPEFVATSYAEQVLPSGGLSA